MKREPKRICSATTSAGNPCKAPAVTAAGLCAAHGGLVDMRAIGKQGGLRRSKAAELEQPATEREQALADIEQGMEAHRAIVRTSGNAAARSRSASELIRLARELERARFGIETVTVDDARERLLTQLEDLADRKVDNLVEAGACPTCERPMSRAEAEALIARGLNESVMGWFARITAKPASEAAGGSGTVASATGRRG